MHERMKSCELLLVELVPLSHMLNPFCTAGTRGPDRATDGAQGKPDEVERRCEGTRGTWCQQYLRQTPIPAKVRPLVWQKRPLKILVESSGLRIVTRRSFLLEL